MSEHQLPKVQGTDIAPFLRGLPLSPNHARIQLGPRGLYRPEAESENGAYAREAFNAGFLPYLDVVSIYEMGESSPDLYVQSYEIIKESCVEGGRLGIARRGLNPDRLELLCEDGQHFARLVDRPLSNLFDLGYIIHEIDLTFSKPETDYSSLVVSGRFKENPLAYARFSKGKNGLPQDSSQTMRKYFANFQ